MLGNVQVILGLSCVLILSACGGTNVSSEPEQASANPDSTIKWQGDWQADTSYALNDLVYFQGQAYINVQPTTGTEEPVDETHWEPLISTGEAGPQGLQGVQGPEGQMGLQGPIGPSRAHWRTRTSRYDMERWLE